MLRSSLLSSLLLLSVGAVFPASAAEQSSTFQANSSVVSSCSIAKERDVTWTSYDPVGLGATQKIRSQDYGILNVKCTRGVVVKYGADEGLNAAAGSTCAAPLRNMKSANGDLLPYRLNHAFQDNGNNVLGCDPNVNMRRVDFIGFDGNGEVPSTKVGAFGYIDPGMDVPVGEYTDTVTATIFF